MDHEIIEDWVETNTRQCKKTCSCGFETRWRQNEKEAMNEFEGHLVNSLIPKLNVQTVPMKRRKRPLHDN